MRTVGMLLPLCLAMCGCGGYYTLTLGDHVGVAGQDAPVVARLQRNDFFVLDLAAKDALMRFRAGDGPARAAYSDKRGYAAAAVPVPHDPGRCVLRVDHADLEGQEVAAEAWLFVWPADRPIVAVAIDDVPCGDGDEAKAARAALCEIARDANVVYLTRRPVRSHEVTRLRLAVEGCPAGPVLPWRDQRRYVVREGRFKVPRVVVEPSLVSQLPELRQMFPKLSVGICASKPAAEAFASAGLRPVVVGPGPAVPPGSTCRQSWSNLRANGI